ncbi:MAG: c-type cytochrome [Methylocystis sp.]|jgi:mono/diheme cytochrome c family protein
MRLAFLSTLVFLSSAVAPALAQGDVTVGKRIAQETCATCHAIGADPKEVSPDPKAPRFLDVARMPSTTELSLKVFLQSSHRNMPNFILSPEEMDPVVGYILGLKKK